MKVVGLRLPRWSAGAIAVAKGAWRCLSSRDLAGFLALLLLGRLLGLGVNAPCRILIVHHLGRMSAACLLHCSSRRTSMA